MPESAASSLGARDVLRLLREHVEVEKGKTRGHLGLPRDIDFSLHDGVLSVRIHNPMANMQTNEAAFEAWILILKRWLDGDIDRVFLDYSVPDIISECYVADYRRQHYNRFLFRLNGFTKLFGDWVTLADDRQAEVASFMDWLRRGPSLLNHPIARARSVIATEKLERQVESWLVFHEGKQLLCDHLALNPDKVFHQLPVGVFHERIAANTAIFTRGASAIDIWGVGLDDETLHLIELKVGSNKGVGAISETLFYAQVLQQACIEQEGFISFGKWGNVGEQRGIDLLRCRKYARLAVHFMAEQFHPLFDSQVCMLIDKGLSAWGAAADQILYDYSQKRIDPA